MTAIPYPNLFSPLRVGSRTLRNRICLPATVTNFAAANMITERWAQFLVERARGGAAMVITEVVAVDPEAVAQATTVIGFDDRNNAGFNSTSAAVEDAGGLMVAQLWHPGRQQLWHPTKSPAGVSDGPDPYSWTVAHVMDENEIHDLIIKFAATAARLHRCGLAGVELHGAHGYLINQFLSPWSNLRNDKWGGDLEGRSRFVREIVTAIRAACGPDFILGLKMPGTESVNGGIDPNEAARITNHLAAFGTIDYFAYGQGNFSLSLENHVPDMYFRPGHFLDIHRQMRKSANGIPVMALGRIGDPALAERAIADGMGDLIGMSRAQISDAAFANKSRQGNIEDIRPCIFDNSSWGEIHQGKPLAEFNNPLLGLAGEADWCPPLTGKPKRIVVVGAGPAGMEAAWVAAARGHHVELFSSSEDIGGALHLEANLPGRSEMARVIGYQKYKLNLHNVKIHLNTTVTISQLKILQPDIVILATGASPRTLKLETCINTLVVSGREYLKNPSIQRKLKNSKVALVDQDQTAATYGLADEIAQNAKKLILITERPHFAQAVNYCSAIGVYRRLYKNKVELVPAMRPKYFKNGSLFLENVYGGKSRKFQKVEGLIYVTPRKVDCSNLAYTKIDMWETFRIGDCQSPRNLLAAIHGGHQVAMAI